MEVKFETLDILQESNTLLAYGALFSVPDDACKGLKRLQDEINPRYFWVSLRGSSGPNQILDSFKRYLDLEIFNFDS